MLRPRSGRPPVTGWNRRIRLRESATRNLEEERGQAKGSHDEDLPRKCLDPISTPLESQTNRATEVIGIHSAISLGDFDTPGVGEKAGASPNVFHHLRIRLVLGWENIARTNAARRRDHGKTMQNSVAKVELRFLGAAGIATILDRVPVARPLFPILERSAATFADFARRISHAGEAFPERGQVLRVCQSRGDMKSRASFCEFSDHGIFAS